MKKISIKLSDYFEIVKPKYIILKVIPYSSIRNYDSSSIVKTVQIMYRTFWQQIKTDHKKLEINVTYKLSFFIDINKTNVDFYFLVPKHYLSLFKEKIIETWEQAKIEVVKEIKPFSRQANMYSLHYKKEDALSLRVDKRSNMLINNILNVLDIMEEDDRVGIFYNFIPRNQKGWREEYKRTMKKIKNNELIDKKELGFDFIRKAGLKIFSEIMNAISYGIANLFSNSEKETQKLMQEMAITKIFDLERKKLSKSTIKKEDDIVIDAQMVIFSDSISKERKRNNAFSVLESYQILNEDNKLGYKSIKRKSDIINCIPSNIPRNTISSDEGQNFIQLPSREALKKYNCIEHTNILQNPLSEELTNGYIRLGTNDYKGLKQMAYMSKDKNLANLGIYVMGQQGSGKTELFKNFAHDIINQNEGLTVIDYIKNCDLANSIEQITPKDKLVVIDLSKEEGLQSFGFNEIEISDDMSAFKILEVSSLQTQLNIELINSIYIGDELSGQMRRYFSSASNIVYTYPNMCLKNVINCLEYPEDRHWYIDNLREDLKPYLEDEIRNLYTLDKTKEVKDKDTKETKEEIIGTNESYIKFILDRVNLLKEDFRFKIMFNKNPNQNINFIDEMNKGSIILIKIPQAKYPLPYHKNILATFFMSKLWLSAQIRGDTQDRPLRHHFMIDEISQAPNVFRVLLPILTQLRKFQLKPILSGHYISQIEPIAEALKASGCSYMLLKGTDKKNYNELKDELKPFELEDLLNLKDYSSLNLIKTKKGWSKFITKLPPKLK